MKNSDPTLATGPLFVWAQLLDISMKYMLGLSDNAAMVLAYHSVNIAQASSNAHHIYFNQWLQSNDSFGFTHAG